MRQVLAIAAGTGLVALLGGTLALTLWPIGSPPCATGALGGGAIGGPFTLVDETGTTVTEAEVIDRPTLIYFGYTFCPDVCPIDNARNAAAVDILAERGHDVKPVFITVDPARDSVAVVNDYTENFHPALLGLTGSPEQVAAAARAYRVVYALGDEDPEFYLVSHSVFTYYMTPEDGFVGFFGREDPPEAVADAVACHLDQRAV